MTNQTIDGVPCSTIQYAITELERHDGPGPRNRAQELRALLDAPVECRCKRYGKGNPHWPCPVHAAPAAKPQGEPVAWMQPGQGGMCISNEVKLHSLKMGGAPASAVSGYSVPLYAGQPAPAAAVPEGWQMVPVAPTDDMIVAFAEAWYSKHQTIDDPSMLEAYHDMLVVAPTYPRQQ